MMGSNTGQWYPTAAYLYTLHLDGPALAWEYLRRSPQYRLDWLHRHRQPETAQAWGLRFLEDPALDARDAHPTWLPHHDTEVQLHPDTDPPPTAQAFAFWGVPGHKQLTHDGKRLVLTSHWPGRRLRLALGPGLEDGMAYFYAIRALAKPYARYRTLIAELEATAMDVLPAAARSRPTAAALMELHTLQALDATQAGASLREVADGLFGADAVAADWHKDSALRARVRRLVRRGDALMHGGYRRLAQLPPFPLR
ncbi:MULTISPECIES: DUF2285 domain-containing protein [Serratia]|uniref:DUF2285 domain-containing protein n=1 Tax=Serratia TaxID=613 RepID=UPI000C176E64|nr:MULTISPECIES: DUF2285 domain-containing protein [Serratia]EIV2911319.1 DUF2285 domain-containing protein [Serratia marcescens]EIV2915686.1 DUF2285 domain-containing protein [Serratia marcescens]MDH7588319.1 DUF2285 domain-containing protein [Serratia bockelmannii]PIJ08864.1 hypothetical protein BVV00_13570 [Serratia sp. OMLW3]PIJ15219.1 hypothetical protein BVU99_13915 [Serratia sp. OLAL2]